MSSQRSYLHNVSLFSNLHGLLSDHLKSEKELAEEKQILNEMLEVVEQRDALVALLEEQRLREKEEDKDLEAVMLSKGFNLNWAWCEGNHFTSSFRPLVGGLGLTWASLMWRYLLNFDTGFWPKTVTPRAANVWRTPTTWCVHYDCLWCWSSLQRLHILCPKAVHVNHFAVMFAVSVCGWRRGVYIHNFNISTLKIVAGG